MLILRGNLQPQHRELVGAICRIITQNVDFFVLVGRQRESQRTYRETVAEVAHDFRTPLQILVLDLQWVRHSDAVNNDPLLTKRIDQSIKRAVAAEEHVGRLLGTATEQRERLDLVTLIGDAMTDLQPMASQHPCDLRKVGYWPTHVWVRGNRYELRCAIANLIENAIKYSWCGKAGIDKKELHKVDVRLELEMNNMVRVRISNYGIGIPPKKLGKIREPGGRGLVPDDRIERSGTGWGLSIAINVLEGHDGWLDVQSVPGDDGPRLPHEMYHRYVTTVDAYLPVI